MTEHLDILTDKVLLREAKKKTLFSRIRKNLDQFDSLHERWRYVGVEKGKLTATPTNPDSHKFRRGKVGEYADYLNQDEIDYIMSNLESYNREYLN